MTTDNRTNEPTNAAVCAALNAYYPRNATVDPSGWTIERRARMRAALVAAQGAAPQAESVPKSSYINPNLPAMIRNLWKSDPSENSVRTALKLAGDLIQELIDLKASPVLPSSGVDEDALGEVIRRADAEWQVREARLETASKLTHAQYVARAVAEWLKEQGR